MKLRLVPKISESTLITHPEHLGERVVASIACPTSFVNSIDNQVALSQIRFHVLYVPVFTFIACSIRFEKNPKPGSFGVPIRMPRSR